MNEFRIRLLLLAVACQLPLFLWAVGAFPGLARRATVRWSVWGAVQLLALACLLAGADLERANRWYAQYRVRESAVPRLAFQATGDFALARRLQAQEPGVPRPALSDGAALRPWSDRLRAELRDSVFRLTGFGAVPPVRVLRTEVTPDKIRKRFIAFTVPDGTEIPAYLFEAPGERRPGVLVLAGHSEGIEETANLPNSLHHAAAYELARAGFTTLTPELRGFGYLGARIENEHQMVAFNALAAGSFYKAVLAQDLVYAVNLMASLPSVDSSRLAVTGVSLGGEMSVTYGVLDPRIRAVAAQGWSGETVGKEWARRGGELRHEEHLCHLVPGQNRMMRAEDWLLLAVPRPLLIVRGSDDLPAHDPAPLLRTAYQALGAPGAFRFEVPRGVHEYFAEPTIRFLREHLR